MSLSDRVRGCPPDGALRALIDGRGDPLVRGHADLCERCAKRLARIAADATVVKSAIDRLAENPATTDSAAAYQRFTMKARRAQLPEESGGNWMKDLWTRPQARAALAVATAVVLMLTVAFSPMRTVANDFLNQFRVQKFAAITIPMNLDDPARTAMFQMMTAGHDSGFAEDFSGFGSFDTTFNVDSEHMPTAQTLDEAATAYAGMRAPTSLPDGFDAAPEAYVTDAGSAAFTLNVDKARQIISQFNLPVYAFDSVTSPDLTFTVNVPAAAIVRYQDATGQNLIVGQMDSPRLDVPGELSMDQLREDILRFPALPRDLAAQLRAVEDWQETLIIPIPEGATSENVTVDGHAGLLVKSDEGNGVLWQADGKLYAVFGQISANDVMTTAKSMASVK